MSKSDKELAVELTIANLKHLETFNAAQPLKSENIAGLYGFYLDLVSGK